MTKLSVEAKVAGSIAAAFVALTVGVIAQGSSADISADGDGYRSTNDAELGAHMSQHGYDRSLAGGTDTEENSLHTQWQLRE